MPNKYLDFDRFMSIMKSASFSASKLQDEVFNSMQLSNENISKLRNYTFSNSATHRARTKNILEKMSDLSGRLAYVFVTDTDEDPDKRYSLFFTG